MTDMVAASIAERRFSMRLLGIFAALAMVLAGVGIYGVISYSVAQRTHEIGIRMALGARPGSVLGAVVAQSMMPARAGVGIGLAASFGLTRLMANMLYGVGTTDPATFSGVALVLTAVALAASIVPARRATRIDPTVALRHE
jgi:putative ABC transport system permease protein